jgi:hypothetical protein
VVDFDKAQRTGGAPFDCATAISGRIGTVATLQSPTTRVSRLYPCSMVSIAVGRLSLLRLLIRKGEACTLDSFLSYGSCHPVKMRTSFPLSNATLPRACPEPIDLNFASENAHDTTALDKCLAADAIVRDEGKRIEGLAAVKAWRIETGKSTTIRSLSVLGAPDVGRHLGEWSEQTVSTTQTIIVGSQPSGQICIPPASIVIGYVVMNGRDT